MKRFLFLWLFVCLFVCFYSLFVCLFLFFFCLFFVSLFVCFLFVCLFVFILFLSRPFPRACTIIFFSFQSKTKMPIRLVGKYVWMKVQLETVLFLTELSVAQANRICLKISKCFNQIFYFVLKLKMALNFDCSFSSNKPSFLKILSIFLLNKFKVQDM